MFNFLFGWRKASQCKKLIKRIQCRLKLLKNKRSAIIQLLREDIAQLLKSGHERIAFSRLEQLYMDENIRSVYNMLDTFADFILLNLSYIRRYKDIPNDVNEAVSTLVFASARLGDLPELKLIRKLFAERYSQKFIIAAVELYPGNLVNCQVRDRLTPKHMPQHVKNRMVDELVRDYFFKPGQLAIEYKPDVQEKEEKVPESSGVLAQDSDIKESTTFIDSAIALQSSPPDAMPNRVDIESVAQLSLPYEYKTSVVDVSTIQEKVSGSYLSERSTQCSEDSVIYLDDVEEFKSPLKQGLHYMDQDQRFFKFKMESLSELEDQNGEHNRYSSYSDTRYTDNGKLVRKRLRRRSVSREKQIINDAQCEIYYGNSPSHRRKCQKKIHFNVMDQSHLLDQGRKEPQTCDCANRHRFSLDEPCYDYANENHGDEVILFREKQGTESVIEYDICGEEIDDVVLASPLSLTLRTMDTSPMRKCSPLRPYVRAVTMPQLRKMQSRTKEVSRSSSFPVKKVQEEFNGSRKSVFPRHVHPKLPDYDEIAAKFRALKKVHQQSNFRS